MITKTETVDIELTPKEIAEVLIDMTGDEQVDVLRELSDYYTFHSTVFDDESKYIKEVIEGLLPVEKERIKGMFDSFAEHMKTIDWEGDTK